MFDRCSVSVTKEAFDRLTAKLPRTPTGRVVGVVSALDIAINRALDVESAAQQQNGN